MCVGFSYNQIAFDHDFESWSDTPGPNSILSPDEAVQDNQPDALQVHVGLAEIKESNMLVLTNEQLCKAPSAYLFFSIFRYNSLIHPSIPIYAEVMARTIICKHQESVVEQLA